MTDTDRNTPHPPRQAALDRPGPLRRWGMFLLGIATIWCFVFVIAPLLQKVSYVGEMHEFVLKNDIDATALVYTDIEEFADADVYIRSAMDH